MRASRFLVIHTFGLGDIIMFTPALELLIKRFPTAQFDFLISYPPVADIVQTFPHVEHIYYKKSGFRIVEQIYELRKRHYDNVIVTSGHSAWKSGLFTRLLNTGCSLGEYEKVCFFDKGAKKERNSHRIASNLRIVAPLTGSDYKTPIQPRIWTERQFDAADDALAIELIKSDKTLIGIHCGSRTTQSSKRWSAQYFCQLLAKIDQVYGNTIFLVFAGEGEAEEAQLISNQLGHCGRIVFDKPLHVVVALLRRCRLMIANDSGIGHLAAAVGTPILSIFGPSDPGKCAPFGDHCRNIRLGNFCSPCIADAVPLKCREVAQCMAALKPDMVFPLVAEMLASSQDAGARVR